MDSGIRKVERLTLYDDDDNPVDVTILYLIFPGKEQNQQFESGRTSFGRKIKPRGTGTYETDAGTILRVLPRGG